MISVRQAWPSPAEEELQDSLTFDEWLVPHKESSVLAKVESDTLSDQGIFSGDTIIIERGRTPQHNDFVVAKVDTDTVIRKYLKTKDGFRLSPAINSTGETIELIGVVTSIIRKFK